MLIPPSLHSMTLFNEIPGVQGEISFWILLSILNRLLKGGSPFTQLNECGNRQQRPRCCRNLINHIPADFSRKDIVVLLTVLQVHEMEIKSSCLQSPYEKQQVEEMCILFSSRKTIQQLIKTYFFRSFSKSKSIQRL